MSKRGEFNPGTGKKQQQFSVQRLTKLMKKKPSKTNLDSNLALDSDLKGEFHERCGKFIALDSSRRLASRQVDASIQGVIFSSRPIQTGDLFQVKIVGIAKCAGSLAIGFTRLDPSTSDSIPSSVDDYRRSEDHWMIWGNLSCSEGLKRDFSTANLSEGDLVGCSVDRDGNLEYFVNGENKGIVCTNIPIASHAPFLWGVVDLCGRIKRIQVEFGYARSTARSSLESSIALTGSNLEHRISELESDLMAQTAHIEVLEKVMMTQLHQEFSDQMKRIEEKMREDFQHRFLQIETHLSHLQPFWSIAQEKIDVTDEILGKGAWSEVVVGVYQGARVATKTMHFVTISDYNRELFDREMEITSTLRHPNLVLFIGIILCGNLTVVSELMETSLRKLMEDKKLKSSDLRHISKAVACALVYLHSVTPEPIIHRNVTSCNVLLNAAPGHNEGPRWRAKLGDFATSGFLAKLGNVSPSSTTHTSPEAKNPSLHQSMSMQKMSPALSIGPKTDVYSFGVLLLEMCTGKLISAHNFESVKETVKGWSSGEHSDTAFLGEWALRCIETDTDKRPDMLSFVNQIWPTIIQLNKVLV